MTIYERQLTTGITRTKGFEHKKLATHAVNVGLRCGHGCLYCSTPTLVRTHRSFREIHRSPFAQGYAIVDPDTPNRVARDAKRIRRRGLIQLCTLTDAWSPEAQTHQLGQRCLKAILSEREWQVRVLTKNAAVHDAFDLIQRHRDRVLVGLSLTATADKSRVIEIIEPHASSIQDRMSVMVEAAARGLRTYAMLCPLLPGISDSSDQIEQLVRFAVEQHAEEIFVEPVNPRGPGLRLCQEALQLWGYDAEADAVGRVRKQVEWSHYVAELVANVQRSVRRHADISVLRFLLYPSGLTT